ncbi:MAG: indole-3-glycerol phosphate synthase [Elusimicrobia bacterium RIFOXYD2_FULL_34_15]|nr:MAG: indole-3-glycerol phosphate synthase [Elusimicrobia bacterium RIFOXYD2_FULL_34_15]
MENNFLDKIVKFKKTEILQRKKLLPLDKIRSQVRNLKSLRNFKEAISKPNRLNLIAEIKKASPSAGVISKDFNVQNIAKQYNQAGVDAISVLTETKYFQGDISYINTVKKNGSLPVLRKDFLIDDYQIYESKYYGADAILLIVAILNKEKLRKFLKIAKKINLSCIVEVHTKAELKIALETNAEIIGINNRNLFDFSVDLNTTISLKSEIPKNKIVISESGIKTKEDINALRNIGVNAVLIGQHFMESKNIKKSIAELLAVA